MKICLSIAPTSVEEARALLVSARRKSDLVEVRVDAMPKPDFHRLLCAHRLPVIITNRSREEGGHFSGSELEDFSILSKAIAAGAEYVDVELRRGKAFISKIMKLSSSVQFIVSHHNVDTIPRDIASIYNKARRTGAHIIKIAFTAGSIADNALVFDLYKRAKKDRQRLIAIAMGPFGEISRILPARTGGFLTYGTLNEKSSTAPGQFTIDELRRVFHLSSLSHRTKVFGLVGNPVSQSLGIYYHNRMFKRKGLDAVYVNFLTDALPHFFEHVVDMVTGVSVTMPYKHEAVNFLDAVSDESRELGAVNTVIKKRNRLVGHNTDLPAIIGLLKSRLNIRSKKVIILGTGSTAATMAVAVGRLGAEVTIVGRDVVKAKALALGLNCRCAPIEQLRELQCHLLMNATPAEMGNFVTSSQDSFRIPTSFFRKGMFVFDAVYDPPETPLLRRARAAGCSIITGLELFTRQARLQSSLFSEAIS